MYEERSWRREDGDSHVSNSNERLAVRSTGVCHLGSRAEACNSKDCSSRQRETNEQLLMEGFFLTVIGCFCYALIMEAAQ